MATISKFYFHDATTTNTGTMPSNSPDAIAGLGSDGDAAGASTARAADDVIGTADPDVESSITATANTLGQVWGHRRFVSAPLAATTLANGSGNWTFSYARTESNLNHNQAIRCEVYAWRPSTGARVGSGAQKVVFLGTEPTAAGAQQAQSLTDAWGVTAADNLAISDGDILVFDVYTNFQQGMATAYNEQFAYDGTTEGSTTTCATFVTPPVALTLFSGVRVPRSPGVDSGNAHF